METDVELISVKKTGEEKLARFISLLFHPLLMPTYGFSILFFYRQLHLCFYFFGAAIGNTYHYVCFHFFISFCKCAYSFKNGTH